VKNWGLIVLLVGLNSSFVFADDIVTTPAAGAPAPEATLPPNHILSPDATGEAAKMPDTSLIFKSQSTMSTSESVASGEPETFTDTGVRVGLNYSHLSYNFKVKGLSNANGDFQDCMNLSVGYFHSPVRAWGYSAAVNFTSTVIDKSAYFSNTIFELYRLDLNGTYAFNERWISEAGINVSQVKTSALVEGSPGVGAQIGMIYQVTPMIGIELLSVMALQTGRVRGSGEDMDMKEWGADIGFNAIF
jgi:hypothetical protein